MNERINLRSAMEVVWVSALLAALIAIGLTQTKLAHEIAVRNDAASITEDRLTKLEAHFVGHTVVLAKDGRGISILPCKLNIDKNCYRDDTGISLSHLNIVGWNVGLDGRDADHKTIPQNSGYETPFAGSGASLTVDHGTFDGAQIDSYQGSGGWPWKLTLFWAHIKQAFKSVW